MVVRKTITIKKRSQPGWLMWLLIVFPFLFGFLNHLLGLPWMIRYSLDAAWLSLGLLMVRFRRSINWKCVKGLVSWMIFFLIYTYAVYMVQFRSPLYYLWGIRNNFRVLMAFVAFSVFLSSEDVESYLKLLDKLFWLNVVVSLVQYIALDLEQDALGGLFGIESGGNAYSNVFFLIVITKSVIFYLDKREKTWLCVTKLITALIVAALAEMKFFFIECIIVIILATLFTRFSWRKFTIILLSIWLIPIGAVLLMKIFPEFEGWFSIKHIWETASSNKGYTSSGDLNRLNAIPQINELWLKTWGQRLFGLGLGNCDTSGFTIVNTPFFERYGDMHYTWLSYAMIYLEMGWIGLVFYFGFFVLVYLAIRKMEKKMDGVALSYCRISRIMCILCAIISVYNSSLRTEAGYMAYFVLAIPFAMQREKRMIG